MDVAQGTHDTRIGDDLDSDSQQQQQQGRSRAQPVLAPSQMTDQHVQQPNSNFPATSAARPPSSPATVPVTHALTYSNEQSPGATTVSPDFQPITDQLP